MDNNKETTYTTPSAFSAVKSFLVSFFFVVFFFLFIYWWLLIRFLRLVFFLLLTHADVQVSPQLLGPGNSGEMFKIVQICLYYCFDTWFGSVQFNGSNASSAEHIMTSWPQWFYHLGHTMGNVQSATPLCLPNNHHWNARARRTTKTADERRSLKVVEEGLEQLRRVKGKLWLATIFKVLSYLHISLTIKWIIKSSC